MKKLLGALILSVQGQLQLEMEFSVSEAEVVKRGKRWVWL